MSKEPNETGSKRRKMRELAMQVLFAWDARAGEDAELARATVEMGSEDDVVRRDAIAMAAGAWAAREASDQWVERIAPQWPPRRQPGVDRSLIRLAVYELTSRQTPPKVVIDEAIELAKTFSTENSPAFVNGVLDAILKERDALVGNAAPPA